MLVAQRLSCVIAPLLWCSLCATPASADDSATSVLPTPSGLSAVLGSGLSVNAVVHLPGALAEPVVVSIGAGPDAGTAYALGTGTATVGALGQTTAGGVGGGAASIAIASAFAAAATAPNGVAIASTGGLGAAWGLAFSNLSGGPPSASASGSGTGSASADATGNPTAGGTGSGASSSSAGSAGGATTSAEAALDAAVNASSVAGPAAPAGFTVTNGTEVTATLSLPGDFQTLVTTGDDDYPAFFAGGGGLDTSVEFSAGGNRSGLRTTGAGATGLSVTADFGGTGLGQFVLGGDDSFIETEGDRAAGASILFAGPGRSSLNFTLQGARSHILTAGEDAPGLLMIGSGALESEAWLKLAGTASRVRTSGGGSHAAMLISASEGAAESGFALKGADSYLSTLGEEAFGAWLQSYGMHALAHGYLSGANSTIGTTGNHSIGAALLSQGEAEARARLGLTGTGANVGTSGADAAGALLVANGGSLAEAALALKGANSAIATQGSRSLGAALFANSGGETIASARLSGAGSSIRTGGEDAHGLFMAANGATAKVDAELSGAASAIETTGANAHGFVGVASSPERAIVKLVLSGESSAIRTEGNGSTGAVLMAGASPESGSKVDLTGRGASITTLGNQAHGVVIGGDRGKIRLISPHALIGTIGTGSHGAVIDGSQSFTLLGRGTGITARGPGSAAIYLFDDTTDHLIVNKGLLSSAYWLAVRGSDGADTLWNYGRIFTGGDPTVNTALDLGDGADRLGLLAGTRIVGRMNVGAGANTLTVETGRDPSALWSIDGALLPGDIEVFGGAPYVVLQPGLLGADTTVATVDPTYFSLSDDALFDIGQAITSGVSSRLSGAVLFGGRAPSPAEPLAYASTAPVSAETYAAFPGVDSAEHAGERRAAWITPFAGAREFDDDAPVLGASHRFAGATGGFDGLVNDTLRVGIFAGGAAGRLEVDQDSQTVETATGAIGGYALLNGESRFLAGILSVGAANNESRRLVLNNLAPNGVETARAEFGSIYVSPEVRAGVRRTLTQHLQIVPTAHLNYTGGWFDDYAETGSSANLQVAARDVHVVEGGLTLPVVFTARKQALQVGAHAGVFGRLVVDGGAADAVLLGQDLSIAAGEDELLGVGAGADFEYGAFGNASLFGSVDVRLASDESVGGKVAGGFRLPF